MIVFDTPRPTTFRRFAMTSHCASTLIGADGTEELLSFAKRIGLRPEWIQKKATSQEHFDLFDSFIGKARRHGAVEITAREFIKTVVLPKREAMEQT